MTGDEEALPIGGELSKYMRAEGFIDFESYNQFTPKTENRDNYQSIKSGYHSLLKNNLDCEKDKCIYISPCDQSKLMNLIDSKLMFPEDFELIEYLASKSKASNCRTSYLLLYSGGMFASVISLVLCQSKRVSFHLPAVIISGVSFLFMKHCYNYFQKLSENKYFGSAITSLQNLCLNVHKLLRLLKETEVLSTGQVTTHNVSSALYIPVKNLKELDTCPSWKTLPQLRKCLANSLLDIVDLLKSTCDEARSYVPDWVHIKGYVFSNENSLLNDHIVNNLLRTEGNISLKDLQLVNDSYLILQSELLKWVGFCLCPSIWNISDSNYNSTRIKILKLFYSSHTKLSLIAFNLKMHYDIQKIFLGGKDQKLLRNDVTEINHMQSELHNLSLLILSMLVHLKKLEDQLGNNANSDRKTDLNILRETLGQQLKNVRDELTSAVNMFDGICSNSFTNKRSSCTLPGKLEKNVLDNPILKSEINVLEESASKPDCHINSSDEVFLAITDIVHDEQEQHTDKWDEGKCKIPKTLLSELSTTLKPIKENFKEREKAALERAGLVDITNESDSENEITDTTHPLADSGTEMENNRNMFKKKAINYKSLHRSKEEDINSDTSPTYNENSSHTLGFSPVQSEKIDKENSERLTMPGLPVLNDKSIANMIAMKSQSWGLAEEECYSDN